MILKQLDDGRLLLKHNNCHMWLNTPPMPKVFNGESLEDLIDDYADWLKRHYRNLSWLPDYQEGVVIDLTD